MANLTDAVTQIQAADLPVLFLNTCSLVDPIRAPLRPADLKDCIEAAQELQQLVTVVPHRCTLVIASFVHGEWLTHAGPEADKLRLALAQIDQDAERFHHFCGVVGITPPFSQPGYRHLPLADRLHDLSSQLRTSALCLDPDQDCIIRAHGRATLHLPPSRQGGEVKDSTIFEECLEVSRRLKAIGFAKKRVFCTSNKDDYCEKGSRLFAKLAVDLGDVDMGFATSLPWAVNEIKKP